MTMTINRAALDLIKEFESFEPKAYIDPVGIWTIGYGTTAAAGVGIAPRAGMVISEKDAAAYLDMAVAKFAREVEGAMTREPTENQFGAMVSLAYNIGPRAFKGSTVLRRFNAGDMAGAADAFLMWNKGTVSGKKVVLKGLVRRREAERALFLAPDEKGSAKPDPTIPNGNPRSDWLSAIIAAVAAFLKGK